MFGAKTGSSSKSTKAAKKATPKKAPKKKAAIQVAIRKRRAPIKEVVGTIDARIPIPEPKPKGKYPFEVMQPGDSFLVQCAKKDFKKVRANVRNASRRVEKKSKFKFTTEISVDEGGVRCWRVDRIAAKKKPAAKKKAAPKPKLVAEKPIELTEELPQTDEKPVEAPTPVTPPETPSYKLPI